MYAVYFAMVDLALPVPDVVDGGGGVYPQPSEQYGIRFLLDLRGRAQHHAYRKLQSRPAGFCHGRPAARRRSYREGSDQYF